MVKKENNIGKPRFTKSLVCNGISQNSNLKFKILGL